MTTTRPATSAERAFVLDQLSPRFGDELRGIRNVECCTDQDEDGDTIHFVGSVVATDGKVGEFSIPEHYPEGMTLDWA